MPSPPKWIRRQFSQFDLLADYFSALARRWQDLLFGESILAVVFLLAWGFDKLSANGLATIFVVAMFVAGYYAWRAAYVRLQPRIVVKKVVARLSPTVRKADDAPTGRGLFVQLIVQSETDAPVTDCRGHLLSVWREVDGEWRETPIDEPVGIHWSADPQQLATTLYPGVPQHLQVFFTHSDGAIKLTTTPAKTRYDGVLNATDKFQFCIKMTAADCAPIDIAIETKVGPKWDQLELLRLVG